MPNHLPPLPPAGLVLAAGASTRMGQPKALLVLPDGRRLAAAQARRLRAAGCRDVRIVLGAEATRIACELPGEAPVLHPGWTAGRCSSLQAGLRALPPARACLVLPVDNVLVRTDTLRVLAAANPDHGTALRPWWTDQPGRVVRLGPDLCQALPAAPAETRVDEWLRPREIVLPVADAGVGSNINSPADWADAYSRLARWGDAW